MLFSSLSLASTDKEQPIDSIILGGASLASGVTPTITFDGQETIFSNKMLVPGYYDLGEALTSALYGKYKIINRGRAGATSYDLPNYGYDLVGDGSVPEWPGLVNQLLSGYSQSYLPVIDAYSAKWWVITLPDDCYFAFDYARQDCIQMMVGNAEESIQKAKSFGIKTIVMLQTKFIGGLPNAPGLITLDQYNNLSKLWNKQFVNRELEGVYTLEIFLSSQNTIDGIHPMPKTMKQIANKIARIIAKN
jgi:hypothetical protein